MALFVACQQDELTGEAGRITFTNQQKEDLTRADNTLTKNYVVNFDVWAHNDNGVVFDGTRVEKQGEVWVLAEEKMWEEEQEYYFHAFAPAGALEGVGEYPNAERARGLGDFVYTNAGDKDLIYAYAMRVQGLLHQINVEPVQLDFKHLLSRVVISFKNNLSESAITISNVQITEAPKSAKLACGDVDMANWAWAATSTGSYSFGGTTAIVKGATASVADVQFLFPAETRNYDISFIIAYESKPAEERTVTISDIRLEMGKSYNIKLVVNDKGISGMENGHEWVDLGLPSGLKWATCNVGASAPEEAGDYLVWGEVESKVYYDWSTYKYGTDYYEMTKYCDNSDYGKDGFVDNKTILDAEDDAATVNWGGAWRMPTYDELNELRTECTWTWTTQNGVNGYKVVSPNGYSIFLPAVGYKYGDELLTAGTGGYYWSSSLYTDGSNRAYYVYFGLDNVYWDGGIRSSGLTVRPVCE